MKKGKVIELGLLPPNHPIYRSGLILSRTLKSILAKAEAEAAARETKEQAPINAQPTRKII